VPSKEGKTYSSYYKNGPQIRQTNNVGVDSTTRVLEDGAGNSTSISLSDDVLSVQPVTDNTVATLLCKTQSGSNVLAVDTENSLVLCGSSQVNALTQYAYFSASLMDFGIAGHHYAIPFQSSHSFTSAHSIQEISMGSDANPDETFDVSASAFNSDLVLPNYWYIVDAITVKSVHIVVGGSAASATDNINFHLMKYDFDTGGGTGDLSGGIVVADQDGTISDVHEDAIQYKSLTVDTSNNTVSAGQVILCTVESTGTTEISCTVTVKFNIN